MGPARHLGQFINLRHNVIIVDKIILIMIDCYEYAFYKNIVSDMFKTHQLKLKGAVTYHRIALTDAERTEKMQKMFIRWRKSSRRR